MTSRRYGTEVLQFDADTFGLAMTGEALAMYYTEEVPPPAEVFLFSPSSALHAIKNPRPVRPYLPNLGPRDAPYSLLEEAPSGSRTRRAMMGTDTGDRGLHAGTP